MRMKPLWVESVTATVKSVVPPAVGLPLISPVEAFSVRPAGSAPVATDHVYGPAPPITLSVASNASSWRTVGMSDNIVDASFQALEDSINYKLLCDGQGGPPQLGQLTLSQPAEEALNVV